MAQQNNKEEKRVKIRRRRSKQIQLERFLFKTQETHAPTYDRKKLGRSRKILDDNLNWCPFVQHSHPQLIFISSLFHSFRRHIDVDPEEQSQQVKEGNPERRREKAKHLFGNKKIQNEQRMISLSLTRIWITGKYLRDVFMIGINDFLTSLFVSSIDCSFTRRPILDQTADSEKVSNENQKHSPQQINISLIETKNKNKNRNQARFQTWIGKTTRFDSASWARDWNLGKRSTVRLSKS